MPCSEILVRSTGHLSGGAERVGHVEYLIHWLWMAIPTLEAQPTVLLAHRYALTREGIGRMLAEAGFDVVGQTAGIQRVQSLITSRAPDVVVLDWDIDEYAYRVSS